VQIATGGTLKVYTLLNRGIHADARPARQVCRLVSASGIREGEGAVVVDGGDVLMRRC